MGKRGEGEGRGEGKACIGPPPFFKSWIRHCICQTANAVLDCNVGLQSSY
jgi:hypothetical protein